MRLDYFAVETRGPWGEFPRQSSRSQNWDASSTHENLTELAPATQPRLLAPGRSSAAKGRAFGGIGLPSRRAAKPATGKNGNNKSRPSWPADLSLRGTPDP